MGARFCVPGDCYRNGRFGLRIVSLTDYVRSFASDHDYEGVEEDEDGRGKEREKESSRKS
jgi:hypothetical protein